MPLVWSLDGPTALRGRVFTAVGTSVGFTGGLGVAQSAAFIITNPGTSTSIVTPIEVAFAPTGTGGTSGCPWGIMKLTGLTTASLAPAGLNAGGFVYCANNKGTAGTAAAVAQVYGTGTLVNGTAGPASANAWNVVEVCGAVPLGTGTNYTAQVARQSLAGVLNLMPGEAAAIYVYQAVAGVPMITWVEKDSISGQ